MESNRLKISEIADFFGVSAKAMRLYEKIGLITPAEIDSNTSYRYYSPSQVLSLNVLVALQSVGFSLLEIKGVLKGNVTTEQFLNLLMRKSEAWKASAKLAEEKITETDHMVSQISQSNPLFVLSALSEEQRAWLLSKMVLIETTAGKRILSEAIWL